VQVTRRESAPVPNVQVQLLEGRSRAQKEELVQELTAAVVRCLAVDPDRVQVLISEFAEGHWARGGIPLRVGTGGAK
jgi:4-oxalocrotonate tautomerase